MSEKKIYLTYTKENEDTGEVYSGRASGSIMNQKEFMEKLRKILDKRDSSHHKNQEGYQEALLDKYSTDKDAVRGREQMLIEYYGGAQSEGGISGNKINSISPRNKNITKYLKAAIKIFGTAIILFLAFSLIKN
jgi:hypothetical protein